MHHLAKFINLAAASPPLGEILLEESQMILIFKRLFSFFPIICKVITSGRLVWYLIVLAGEDIGAKKRMIVESILKKPSYCFMPQLL